METNNRKNIVLNTIFIIFFIFLALNRFFIGNTFFIIIFFFTCYILLNFNLKKKLLRESFYFLILVVYCFLSTIWSVTPKFTMMSSIHLLIVFILGFAFLNINSKDNKIKLITLFFFTLSLANIIAVLFFDNLSTEYDFRYGKVFKGLFNQKNGLGKYMSLAIFVATWGCIYYKSIKWKLLNLLTILFALPCLLLSKSSTSLAISLLLVLLLILLKNIKSSKRLIKIWSTCLIIFVALLVKIPPPLEYFIQYYLERDTTFTGRIEIWKFVRERIFENLFNGYGFQAFWSTQFFDFRYIRAIGFNPTHAHNGFLDLLLGLGLIGFLIYIIIPVSYFYKSYKKETDRKSIMLGLGLIIGIWLNNLLETDLIYPYSMFFLLQFFSLHLLIDDLKTKDGKYAE